jgi:hypothetical protein
MAIKNPEPPALTAAKKRYGDGVWEPHFIVHRNNRRRIIGIDYSHMKFWPYKKWILHDGKWMPSIEMYEMPEKRKRLSFIERMRLKHREWEMKFPPTGK